MFKANIKNKDSSLIAEFPMQLKDLYSFLRLLDCYLPPMTVMLTDKDPEDIQVTLYSDTEIGQHLIKLLDSSKSLYDANILANRVAKANEIIKKELEDNIIRDKYRATDELYSDIIKLLYNAASVTVTMYFPITGSIFDEYGKSIETDNRYLLEYQSDIQKRYEQYTRNDNTNMAEYYNGAGKEKLLLADWGFDEIQGKLYGKVDLRLSEPLTDNEEKEIKRFIRCQNCNGLIEGFEKCNIHTDDGVLNISLWQPDKDYFVYTKAEMDEYMKNLQSVQMGGM